MNSHFDIARKFRYRLTAEIHQTAADLLKDPSYYGASEEIQEVVNAYMECLGSFYKHYVKPPEQKTKEGFPRHESGAITM